MNELQIFNNEEFGEVRTIEIDGEPWFVASDIAKALNYRMASDMTRRLDEEDKGTHKVSTLGGEQVMTVINESGLYSSILGSNLPSAKRFKHWVTSEVLPTIRKTGKYEVQQTPRTYLEALKALVASEEEKQRLAIEMVAMSEKIEKMQPKITYLDEILESKDTVLVTQIAKDYGMSAKGFNKMLHDMCIQHKVGGQWVLYSKYQGEGYTHSHTHSFDYEDGSKGTSLNTEWTQKGRLFLYNFLKERGKLPLIERSE